MFSSAANDTPVPSHGVYRMVVGSQANCTLWSHGLSHCLLYHVFIGCFLVPIDAQRWRLLFSVTLLSDTGRAKLWAHSGSPCEIGKITYMVCCTQCSANYIMFNSIKRPVSS
jgi:hypothetical protein